MNMYRTEEEHIQQSLKQSMSGTASRAMWPARGETPINEFHTLKDTLPVYFQQKLWAFWHQGLIQLL